jgi:hypothetical protein
LLTFHKIFAGCTEGNKEAWQTFLAEYSPAMIHLGQIYLDRQSSAITLWQEVLGAVCAENFDQLQSLEHQSEPEFLAGLRSFLLEQALTRTHSVEGRGEPELTLGHLRDLLKDLPLLHQEILFLKLAGYSGATLEAIFRISPAVAERSADRLRAEFGPAFEHKVDACPFPAAWLQLQKQAREARTENCPALRQFARIQDGQAGWYDKEPAETHLAACLRCLEAATGLREIKYWRGAAPRIPANEIENLLSRLPVQQGSKEAKPLRKRIFG